MFQKPDTEDTEIIHWKMRKIGEEKEKNVSGFLFHFCFLPYLGMSERMTAAAAAPILLAKMSARHVSRKKQKKYTFFPD